MTTARAALLLAALLTLAAPAAALSGPGLSPPGRQDEPAQESSTPQPYPVNTTSTLTLDGDGPAAFVDPDDDLAGILDVQQTEFRTRFTEYAVVARYRAADSDQARRALLLNASARMERAVDDLRAEEREARRAYVSGELSAESYVRTLGVIDARAREIETSANRLVTDYGFVRETPGFSDNSLDGLRAKLVTVTGPVRARVTDGIQGGDAPPTYVEASENGVVLSTVEDGEFVREAYREDLFHPEIADQATPANELIKNLLIHGGATEFYPWGWNLLNNEIRSRDYAVVLQFGHDHGSVTAYVDGNSKQVYREEQTKLLRQMPTAPPATATRDGVRLAANETYPGGPLRVSVTDVNGSSTPIQSAVVLVNGTYLGETSPDGVVWGLGREGSYNVTALWSGKTYRVTVDAYAARPLGTAPPSG